MILPRVARFSSRRGLLNSRTCAQSQWQCPARSFHATCYATADPLPESTRNGDGAEGNQQHSVSGGGPKRNTEYAVDPSIVKQSFENDRFLLRIDEKAKETHGPSLSFKFITKLKPKAADSSELSNSAPESPDSTALRKPRLGHRKSVTLDWLREACRCDKCADPKTMQRKYNVLKVGNCGYASHTPWTLDNTSKLGKMIRASRIVAKAEGFEITWDNDHISYYDNKWIQNNLFWNDRNISTSSVLRRGLPYKVHFGSELPEPPSVRYSDIINDSGTSKTGMYELLHTILSRGFCLVTETPKTPEATKSLLERIGPIRNTHYGGFYDFQPNLEYGDTAYTNEALDVHTDTTYFTDPAGLQAFHLLSHYPPPGGSEGDIPLGGATRLVDGFKAAVLLRKEDPGSYEALTQTLVPWHASGNEDVAIAPMQPFPVLERAKNGHLFRIRWNNDDRGVLRPQNIRIDDRWYAAASLWTDILQRPANVFNFQLQPGNVLIFDNWRVLHGRTAFEGARRMCGAYISRDDAISRWRISGYPREDVIGNNMRLQGPTT